MHWEWQHVDGGAVNDIAKNMADADTLKNYHCECVTVVLIYGYFDRICLRIYSLVSKA